MIKLLLLVDDYVKEIKNKDYYKKYIYLNDMISDKYFDLIKLLNEKKEKYDEISKYGKYAPDFKEISNAYQKIKMEVMMVDEIKQYFFLNRKIEEEINDFFREISLAISPNIPVINKLGFISLKKGKSCSGSCK